MDSEPNQESQDRPSIETPEASASAPAASESSQPAQQSGEGDRSRRHPRGRGRHRRGGRGGGGGGGNRPDRPQGGGDSPEREPNPEQRRNDRPQFRAESQPRSIGSIPEAIRQVEQIRSELEKVMDELNEALWRKKWNSCGNPSVLYIGIAIRDTTVFSVPTKIKPLGRCHVRDVLNLSRNPAPPPLNIRIPMLMRKIITTKRILRNHRTRHPRNPTLLAQKVKTLKPAKALDPGSSDILRISTPRTRGIFQ